MLVNTFQTISPARNIVPGEPLLKIPSRILGAALSVFCFRFAQDHAKTPARASQRTTFLAESIWILRYRDLIGNWSLEILLRRKNIW